MTDQTNRARRIARRLMLCVSALLMLLALYVANWFVFGKAWNLGYVPVHVGEALRPVFHPAVVYADSDLWGAFQFNRAFWLATWEPGATPDEQTVVVGPFSPLPDGYTQRELAARNRLPNSAAADDH